MKPWQNIAAALALGVVLGMLAADAMRPRLVIQVCDELPAGAAWL